MMAPAWAATVAYKYTHNTDGRLVVAAVLEEQVDDLSRGHLFVAYLGIVAMRILKLQFFRCLRLVCGSLGGCAKLLGKVRIACLLTHTTSGGRL